MNLKISTSGVRGVIGETLTPELIVSFAQAFGTYMEPGTLVVGRDTRTSGEMIQEAVVAGLTSVGRDVVDVGMCPVPVAQHFLARADAVGGIAITGSHNQAQWNALKFLRGDGTFIHAYQADELFDIYHRREFNLVPWNRLGRLSARSDLLTLFADDLRASFALEAIRDARPRVAVDCCNGTGSLLTVDLLRSLGCEVTAVHASPDGHFPHDPEPIPANLSDLRRTVEETGAQIGFAQDVDADRVTIVAAGGLAIAEDHTLLLAALNLVRAEKGPIVTSIDTTSAIDDLGLRYGCPVYRSKVGEVNVVEKMRSVGAVIGGEGSGGVIYPPFHPGRDSFVAMVLILTLLAETGKTVPQLLSEFPGREIVKTSLACPTDCISQILAGTRNKYRSERLDLLDGIKVSWPDRWVMVRLSDTEPVLRVTAEAPSREEALALCAEIRALAEESIGRRNPARPFLVKPSDRDA